MVRQVFEIEGGVTLSVIQCQGDLVVQGWSRPAVRVQGDDDHLRVKQEGETIMVSCRSDLRIDAPQDACLKVQMVEGDASVKRIFGGVSIEQTARDLVLTRVAAVTVGLVRGDLSARVVEGDLVVRQVDGDMSVRSVSGRLQVEQVGRDLGVRDATGNALAEHVQGDIRLRTAIEPGVEHSFKADRDIVAHVPTHTNADLFLRCGRGKPQVRTVLTVSSESEHEITGRLGEGGASLHLEAGRDLVLAARESDQERDWDKLGVGLGELGADLGMEFAGLAEEIASQIELQMAEMSAQLEEKLAGVARLDAGAARAAERAQREAERAAEHLRRAAERQAEHVRRRTSRSHWRVGRTSRAAAGRPAEPESGSEPVSNEERMVILNMVAEGKITVQEAEALLEALGGQ